MTTDKTEDTLSDYEEEPLVVRSSEDVEVEDEYYEDDLGASHGDQEPYSDSGDVMEGSDSEKTSPTNPQSWCIVLVKHIFITFIIYELFEVYFICAL